MKIKLIASALLCTVISVTAVHAEAQEGHDFTFGLKDNFPAVMAFDENETGEQTLERFQQIRSELPDELPIFEPYETEGKQAIYVAKTGDDSNSGTIDKPLKTFEEAFSRAAAAPKTGDGFVIYVREGIYSVGDGLNIPEHASGSETCPVIMSAYPGETVKLTGGISVDGNAFKIADDETAMRKLPQKSRGRVYSVNLKDVGYTEFPSLTVNSAPKLTIDGTEYTIARWPNSENVAMKKYEGEDAVRGVIDTGPVASVGALTNAPPKADTGQGFEFCILDQRPFTWENTGDIWLYGSFFAEYFQNYYKIKDLNEDRSSVRAYGGNATYGASYNADHTFYYLNVLEELDIPGEWYLDKDSGILYIYPIKDLAGSSIDIAMSESNIVTFDKATQYFVLSGMEITGTTADAVKMSGYRNILQKCTVKDCGSSIRYENAKNCGTISNKLYGAVNVWNSINGGIIRDEQNLRPTRNFIQNNVVYDASITVRYGVQQIVAHNTILNCPSMCIYLADTMESIVEYNEVAGGPYRTIDGGMLYLEGVTGSLYNHVRYNFFHHSTMTIRSWPFGIYFDDVSSNNFAYGNILQQGSMFMHGGHNNTFYNNVVVDNTSSAPSIYNSDNYYKIGGMSSDAFFKSGGRVWWENSGTMKIEQITWKNRYPALYSFWQGLREIEKLRLDPDYVRGPVEQEWIRPRRNAYVNTLLYNSNAAKEDNKLEAGTALFKDNYVNPKENSPFVDYENINYSIASYDEVRKNIPTFEEIPTQDRRGVTEFGPKVSQSDKIYPMTPVAPEIGREFINNLSFKWSKSPEAAYYHFELASDENFENIIAEEKSTYNYFTLEENLEVDTTYFWRVTAYAYGQCVENKTIVMDTATFRTYTYEEAAAETTLDISGYEATRDKIKNLVETSVFEDNGTDIGRGVYNAGTKDKIFSLLDEADVRVSGYALQAEVEKEIKYIGSEYIKILKENAIPYTRTYKTMNIGDWVATRTDNIDLNVNGNELSIDNKGASVDIARDTRLLSPKERVKVMINCGDMKTWNAFAIKQVGTTGTMVTSIQGYYIIFKTDAIELQRYPAVGGAIKSSVANTGIIKPNTWHEIEIACEETESGGSKITFIVDGAVIMDYTDEETPINELGYFSIQNNGNDSKSIKIKGVE